MVKIKDLVILLPGIMGSVLQKNNRDVWAISGQALWDALLSRGFSVEQLLLKNDNVEQDLLDDGIYASRLISDVHIIPGLVKIDGYTAISKMVTKNFEVIQGQPNNPAPANFFEFPYDWRRDCRVAAKKLKKLIDYRLPQWREYTRNNNAKVILIGHSMGGLVSRHYLEMLDGWKDCKALITFGTPYRGSINALDYLGNGYKRMFLDFSDLIRSFTGVYQLLPTYKVIKSANEYKSLEDLQEIPGVDHLRAKEALNFHHDIEKAVKTNQKDPDYRENGYKIFPIIGIKQPSLQSIEIIDGKTISSNDIPSHIGADWGDGDGTVPMVSAIPSEIINDFRDTCFVERHGSIQNNKKVLDHIYQLLKRTQLPKLPPFLGSQKEQDLEEMSAIRLDLDDLYVKTEESVMIRAELLNTNGEGLLRATIESTDGLNFHQEYIFDKTSDGFNLNLENIPEGIYRIKVEASNAPNLPSPVQDVFGIA